MNKPVSDMLGNSMSKLREMIDVNTIIGNPITTPEGVTIIPVSRVKIGLGGGGSDFTTKTMRDNDTPYGGGIGCGVNIDPVAFLIIRGESVRLLPVAEPASTTIDRVIEMAPDIIDKVADFIDTRIVKKDAE